jgi:F-type H+-transporting ATPase subunit alpha
VESKYADLLKEIKDKNEISDELEEKLKKALDEFKSVFQPPGQ